MTDIDNEGSFQWESDNEDTKSYNNWAPNRPNSRGNQDCVHLWHSKNHMWNDRPCARADGDDNRPTYALCQKTIF